MESESSLGRFKVSSPDATASDAAPVEQTVGRFRLVQV